MDEEDAGEMCIEKEKKDDEIIEEEKIDYA